MSGATEAAAAAAAATEDGNAICAGFNADIPERENDNRALKFLENRKNIQYTHYNLVVEAFATHVRENIFVYEDDKTLKKRLGAQILQHEFPCLFTEENYNKKMMVINSECIWFQIS